MFKVGDIVVFDNTKESCASLPNHLMKYVDLHPEWPQDRLVLIDGVLNEVSHKVVRMATPEEIAAGHRIDCEVLDMVDVSPHCEVIDENI